MLGLPKDADGWSVGLEDPRQPDRDLTTLTLRSGSCATSSVTKRKWLQSGETMHHIIDPRTGEPAQSPWLSVTVLSPSATEAEAFAKACLIGGPQLAPELVATRTGMVYLGRRWRRPFAGLSSKVSRLSSCRRPGNLTPRIASGSMGWLALAGTVAFLGGARDLHAGQLEL